MIRIATTADAKAISDIYNYYIKNTIITFEEEPVSYKDMEERIFENSHIDWLVYEEYNEIKGYAYASKWKSRCAYRHSLESTIYLKNDAIGNGIGSRLYSKLIDNIKSGGYHAVIGGIALPNDSSIKLHEKLGFEKVAQFKEVGYKFNRWVDVGYWELIFDND